MQKNDYYLKIKKKGLTMILEYNFRNVLSFKELNTFSMLGVNAFKEHEPDNVIYQNKFKILKSAAIYGGNASGKSNFVKSLNFMKYMVKNSFKNALSDNKNLMIENFLLNNQSVKSPSLFEIVFYHKNVRYRYGFEIFNGEIINEWLYSTIHKKEVFLFERERQNFRINKSSFKEGINLESKTRKNVLFLSLVAQFNGEITNNVIDWFNNVNIISGIQDLGYSFYTIEKLRNDKNFKSWLSRILRSLEIANLSIEEIDLENEELEKFLKNTNNKNIINIVNTANGVKSKKIQILTWHNKFDENNLLIETIPFDFDRQESEGTKKFFYLLGPWYDTLKNGRILIVDELDSRLHTLLTKRLIELFHKYNKNRAQLIFTSHDSLLLDKNLFRRDQIWFVEKDQFGSSQLYSLADFKTKLVRKSSSFYKNYLEGKYGAITDIELTNNLMELLNSA